MNKKTKSTIYDFIVLTLLVLFFYGYGANLASIMLTKEMTGELILRIIGVFIVPLGSILGFV